MQHQVTDYRPWPTAFTPPTPDSSLRGKPERIVAIDAARGIAILLVMLSHFAMRFASEAGADGQLRAAVLIGMIASPTFVLLSGAVYGTLAGTAGVDTSRLRTLLFDRGLFLIVVAHPLLAASNLLRGTPGSWHHIYITDTIAPALLLGPWLAHRTRQRTRLLLGGALIVGSWFVLALPTPAVLTGVEILREAAVGTLEHGGESWWGYHWPLAQWFGVYLFGTVIGEHLSGLPVRPWRVSRSRWLFRAACIAALTGAAMNLGFVAITRVSGESAGPVLSHFTRITSKFPPSAAYLLWFGGLGLGLVALVYAPVTARWHSFMCSVARPFGRSSLVLYITSDYLFHVPFVVWHPTTLHWWLPTFALLLIPLYCLALVWSASNGNRLLTVGYPFRARPVPWIVRMATGSAQPSQTHGAPGARLSGTSSPSHAQRPAMGRAKADSPLEEAVGVGRGAEQQN